MVHAINDNEDESLEDIAPPEESDMHDSMSVYCTCALTKVPEMRKAPPSSLEEH
jgi:hypothetical protein